MIKPVASLNDILPVAADCAAAGRRGIAPPLSEKNGRAHPAVHRAEADLPPCRKREVDLYTLFAVCFWLIPRPNPDRGLSWLMPCERRLHREHSHSGGCAYPLQLVLAAPAARRDLGSLGGDLDRLARVGADALLPENAGGLWRR